MATASNFEWASSYTWIFCAWFRTVFQLTVAPDNLALAGQERRLDERLDGVYLPDESGATGSDGDSPETMPGVAPSQGSTGR